MKALHLPNYYYPNIGGIEQVARDVVNAWKEKGITDQIVICMNQGSNRTITSTVDDIEVVYCSSPIKFFSQSLSTDYKKVLRRTLREEHPDIIVLHWPNPFTAFTLLQELKEYRGHPRIVLYWHSDIVKQRVLGKLLNGITERIAKRADVIIPTSPNYLQGSDTLQRYRDKCIVVPNSINTDRLKITPQIEERARQIKKDNEGKVFCFAFGRDVPYKGFKYLDEARKYIEDDIIVKRGEKLTEEELKENLLACDIFCFPSITKNEAFGLALAEAMYYGKPAVTFTIPGSGVNYVSVDSETGTECPNRDAKAYAEAINTLARDKDLREKLGSQARNRVLEKFVYEKFKENIWDRRIFSDTTS